MARGGKREGAGRKSASGEGPGIVKSYRLPLSTVEQIEAKASMLGVGPPRLVALAVEAYEVTPPEAT